MFKELNAGRDEQVRAVLCMAARRLARDVRRSTRIFRLMLYKAKIGHNEHLSFEGALVSSFEGSGQFHLNYQST